MSSTYKAINIAILPDLNGMRAARYLNCLLRENKCCHSSSTATESSSSSSSASSDTHKNNSFEFDSTHHPHITLFQLFMRSDRIEELFQKIKHRITQSVINSSDFTSTTRGVDRLSELPPDIRIKGIEKGQNFADQGEEAFLPGLVMDDSTNYLYDIHQSIATIAKDFVISPKLLDENEKRRSFFTLTDVADPQEREITRKSVDYVSSFHEKSAFENFSAHMAVGTGSEHCVSELVERVDKLLPQMPVVTFKPEKMVIAQLGNYCTCRNILYELPLGKQFF